MDEKINNTIPEILYPKIETTIEPAGDYVKYENKIFFQNFHKVPTLEARLFRGDARDDESIDEETSENFKFQVSDEPMAKVKSVKFSSSCDLNDRKYISPPPPSRNMEKKKCQKSKSLKFENQKDNKLFEQVQKEKSTEEYNRVSDQVISKLHELGIVNNTNKIKFQSHTNSIKKSNSCFASCSDPKPDTTEKVQQPTLIPPLGEHKKSLCSISVNGTTDLETKTTIEDHSGIKKEISKGFLTRFGKSLTDLFSRRFKNVKHRGNVKSKTVSGI